MLLSGKSSKQDSNENDDDWIYQDDDFDERSSI